MPTTNKQSAPTSLVLRTAAVWGTFVLASRDLTPGQSLPLGEADDALISKPDGSSVVDYPIRATGNGWELDVSGCTGGALQLRGRAEDPVQLGASGAPVPIVAGDHGLLQYGAFSVFFQFSTSARPPKARLRFDWSLVLAFAFAVITVGGALLLFYLLFPVQVMPAPLELTTPEELQVRYRFTPPVEQPAPDPGEGDEGASGAKAKEAAPKQAVKRKERAESAPRQAPSQAQREPTRSAPPGTSAMTDALQSDVGKEVLETLGTISSVQEALGGLADAPIVLGGNSGSSVGLQGQTGSGSGGGTARYGAGTLKTGLGTGVGTRGSGKGKGRGQGKGAAGSGRGGERKLAAEAPTPKGQSLSREQISRVVNSRARAFQACYETALARNPGLEGGVTVQLTIGGNGKVSRASIAKTSLDSKRVEGCLLRMFRRLRFPQADLETHVNWPLVFKGKR